METDFRNSDHQKWIKENPELYAKTLQLQTELSSVGISWHNPFSNECCSDFSCCSGQDSKKVESIISDIEVIVNRNSLESGSNTPDFIIAKYLYDCLQVYNAAVKARDKWFSIAPSV